MTLQDESIVSDVLEGESTRVLIIEDNPADADLLGEYLEAIPDRDFEVARVETLEAGFNVSQQETPDLLFLDLNLPDASPEESVRSIRHFPEDLPIIVLSGSEDGDLEISALNRGAQEFLAKERIDTQVLSRCIAHAVERTRIVEKLRERERELLKYKMVIDESPEIVVMKDVEGRYELVNPAFEEFSGYEQEEVIGKTTSQLFGEEIGRAARNRDRTAIESGSVVSDEEVYEFEEGERRVFDTVRCPYEIGGEIAGIIAIVRDVTEREVMREELEERALHDELTHMPNRALFRDRLRRVIGRARTRPEQFGLVVVDLDDFTTINESLGHTGGDEVLREVGAMLDRELESEDTVARVGADEFACILTEITDRERLDEVADNLEEAFAEPVEVHGSEMHLTASMGFGYADVLEEDRDETDEMDALIRTANRAKHKAKQRGGTSWEVYRLSDWGESSRRVQRANRIRKGLKEGEFLPFYQPLYRLDNDRLMAFEVLARWDRADRGLVSPADFIPLAEDMGLIADVGNEVAERAFRELEEQDELFDEIASVNLLINLSPRQLDRPEIVHELLAMVDAKAPERVDVGFEVTETDIIQHRSNALILRDAGYDLWVDDFGTGYSSLARLKEIPVDGLKLDMEFVHGVTEDTEDAAIAYTVAELGRRMGVPVVAEGVETQGQFEFLKGTGCTAAQGFLFAHPQPIHNLGVAIGD